MNRGVVSVSHGNEAVGCAIYQKPVRSLLEGGRQVIRTRLREAVTAAAGFAPWA